MRFALWSMTSPAPGLSHVEIYENQLRECEEAERLGFDHMWFFEHHVSPSSPIPSPNLMIAAAAQRTRRIRLGAMVNILPYRNPLLLAEEIAMLDTLTRGRLDMGVGRGLKPVEFDAFGVDQARSRRMFLESIDVMKRVWADENFIVERDWFRIDKKTPLAPGVVQKPHPPFYISAQSAESLRWAAENDVPFAQIDALVEECERDCAFYRDIHARAGHSPAPRLVVTREIFVADTDAEARRIAEPFLARYWELWGRYAQFTAEGRMPDDYDAWRKRAPVLSKMSFDELAERGLIFVGSPATVARQINRHAARLDILALACVFKFGGMPLSTMLGNMRRFAREVRPLLGASGSPARSREAGR